MLAILIYEIDCVNVANELVVSQIVHPLSFFSVVVVYDLTLAGLWLFLKPISDFFCQAFVCVYTLYFNNLHWSRIWQCSIMYFGHFVAFGYVRFWIT